MVVVSPFSIRRKFRHKNFSRYIFSLRHAYRTKSKESLFFDYLSPVSSNMNYSVQSTVGELGKWFIPIIVPGMSDKLSNTPIRILVSASIIMVLVITFSQMFKGRSTEIPYFYLSNSNWFDRLLEPFRLLTRMNEAILKGYKMVPLLFDCGLIFSSPINFSNSPCSTSRRV